MKNNKLPDLTQFINGQDWWNKDNTNALMFVDIESNRAKNICLEMNIDRMLKRITK